jgi:hypothetical protein
VTGIELVYEALRLINYTNPRGEVDTHQAAEVMQRSLTLVNTILADVQKIEGKPVVRLAQLSDELMVEDDTAYNVMPWGVGMLIAQSAGDGDNQQLCAAMYNQKRGSIQRPSYTRRDALPTPWSE